MFAFNVVMRAIKGGAGDAALFFRIRANAQMWAGINSLQAIYEFELREAGDATGVNLSLTATKTASDFNTYPANGGGDGNATSYWQSATGASSAVSWWQCQFASPKTVRSVVIKPHTTYYAKSYIFEQSNDGITWTPVKTVATTGGSGGAKTFLNIRG